MSKGHSECVISIPLSTTSILGNELERVPARSIPFMLLYHMGDDIVLMPKRKAIREFRGWGALLVKSAVLRMYSKRVSYPQAIFQIYGVQYCLPVVNISWYQSYYLSSQTKCN